MRRAASAVLFFLIIASGSARRAAAADSDYLAEIESWHAQREAALAAEDGWLSLVGLLPIAPGAQTIGSGPAAELPLIDKAPAMLGTLVLTAEGELSLETAPGVEVRVDGEARSGRIPLASDAGGSPTQFEIGTLRCYAIDRGGELFLRVKDSENPDRLRFAGVERFPVDRRWRVEARLEAGSARSIAIPNVLGQVEDAPCPGRLVFTLQGRECSLWPIAEAGQELFIVFADGSTGDTTYGGGRFLSAPAPDAEGRVILDFNRAVNPPCAFSPYATCPLPPTGNTLPLTVQAGELDWGEEH